MHSDKDTNGKTLNICPGPPGKNDEIILLSLAACDKKYRVVRILGGTSLHSRLHSMGIVPNETLKVVLRTGGGPMAIAIKGVKIALGRGISHKIEVSEINELSQVSEEPK